MSTPVGKPKSNKDLPFTRWLTELPNLLTCIDRWKRILFLAACCERQFGNYVRFHQETGWGNPQTLCNGLQALWNYSGPCNNEMIGMLRSSIEAVTPDTEDFESPYTSAALDASISILESIDYCLDDDLDHCVKVACSCRDTVYMYAQQRRRYGYSDADEVKIYADPLVQRELQAQQSDLARIRSLVDRPDLPNAVEKHHCDPDIGSLRG